MNSDKPGFDGITLIGLGPGDPDLLTCQSREWLSGTAEVYTRVKNHPVLQAISSSITITDLICDSGSDGDSDLAIMMYAQKILDLGRRSGGVTYAVSGHPLIGESVCKAIINLADENEIPVRVIDGMSIIPPVFNALNMASPEKFVIVDALELVTYNVPSFPPSIPALFTNCSSQEIIRSVKKSLISLYPNDHLVNYLYSDPSGKMCVEEIPLDEIDARQYYFDIAMLYLPALSGDTSFEALHEVVARLRAPDGCPWDRTQTHDTLRQYLLEETYEVLAALDEGDIPGMCEEFGDLLLQIILHAQIASESGVFNISDVLQGINRKLVSRHPHVFADQKVSGVGGVLKNWEAIKAKERQENGEVEDKGLLGGVPLSLPALTQALDYQERAGRVGFDWPDIHGVWKKVEEELQEVREANGHDERAAEIGDLLFAVVNLARWLKIDAESHLRETNQRFRRRFAYIEQNAKLNGQSLEQMAFKEMDDFWDEAKRLENE
jgi:tetrapyrrole methylase family protein / MazG family protein